MEVFGDPYPTGNLPEASSFIFVYEASINQPDIGMYSYEYL